MAFADALVKLISADLTVWQIFVVRSLFALPLLLVISLTSGVGLKPKAPGWALLRSGLLVLTWLAFYASLPVLSLSVAAVAMYTNPIMIVLLTAVMIGEPVARRQGGACCSGFSGSSPF